MKDLLELPKLPNYSEIENFNVAAIEAVRNETSEKDIREGVSTVFYSYKGRILKVKAKVKVWGYMEGSLILEDIKVLSVHSIKKGDLFVL